MHILLTNDDGILAPGLAAIYRELAADNRVTVAAPASVQSAMSHAVTVGQAIEVRKIYAHDEFFGWSIDGRPADCVKLAVAELLDDPPDLVVSGINDGANYGINVLYSGTVAAAAEGALLGYPAVAVSLKRSPTLNFPRAAQVAWTVIQDLLATRHVPDTARPNERRSSNAANQASRLADAQTVDTSFPREPFGSQSHDATSDSQHRATLAPGQLININIPDLTPGLPNGVRVAAQALQRIEDDYDREDLPDGVRRYGLFGELIDPVGEYDTDLHAVQNGYVAVTPLQADLTDYKRLPDLASMAWTRVS